MNLRYHYWYFKSALTPKFCDEVITHAYKQKEEIGKTGTFDKKNLSKDDIYNLKKIRNSDVVWLNDRWIYKEIQPYVHIANKNAGWNFEWNETQACQFTKYKLNQYYDWHTDSSEVADDRLGRIRKLSMTCQLTDGSEYKGGELEFDFRNYDPHMRDESKHRIQCKEILPKGSIIVFPSFVWHRVKPVTSGIRHSLVAWSVGQPFK